MIRLIIVILIVIFDLFSLGGQVIFNMTFDESDDPNYAIEQVRRDSFEIQNFQNKVERINRNESEALRLDGWSTWIEIPNYSFGEIKDQMTIQLWYGTESFSAGNGGLVSQIGTNGFSLEIDAYGHVIWAFHADGIFYFLRSDQRLSTYTWNHITAIIDLPNQLAAIYVNGNEWSQLNLDNHERISIAQESLHIGKQTNAQFFDQFDVTVSNGAIDDIKIFQNVDDTLLTNVDQDEQLVENFTIDPDLRHAGSHLRPRYHPMPSSHWTNEAYGLIYVDNMYHLFFQKNPNGPYLNFMHWGHLTSPDLVQWTEQKIALSPEEGNFDNAGTWSGTTVLDELDEVRIIYTAVNGVNAGIGMASPVDSTLNDWEKSTPLFNRVPDVPRSLDWRDPYIWKQDENYYMIIGSGLINNSGPYLFTYKSKDLVQWDPIDDLYRNRDTDVSGVFWEMPSFVQLPSGHYLLTVTTVPKAGNQAKTLSWLGEWENEEFTPFSEEPLSLELFSERSLAPAFGYDTNNDITYISIIPEDRNVNDQIAEGWRQVFSLPKIIREIDDEKIGSIPHPNICRLRESEIDLSGLVIDHSSSDNLGDIHASQSEIAMTLAYESDDIISLDVFKNNDGLESTTITFDTKDNQIILDRTNSSLSDTPRDFRISEYFFNPRDTLQFRVFLDKSIIEVFLDNLVVFSSRVYPSRSTSDMIDIRSELGRLNLVEAKVWNMKDASIVQSQEICIVDELPQSLYSDESVSTYQIIKDSDQITINPNPARDIIRLSFTNGSLELRSEVRVYNQIGELMINGPLLGNTLSLNTVSWSPGRYTAQIYDEDSGQTHIKSFIKL